MSKLWASIKSVTDHNRDGSFATQKGRIKSLNHMGSELREAGYKLDSVHSLKPKHVTVLVEGWQKQGLAIGTIKARLSHLRWLVKKIGKANIVPRTNAELGIGNRTTVNTDRAREKAEAARRGDLSKVRCERERVSLELTRAFGVRREGAVKFQPHYADRGDHVALKGSWTKGGKPQVIKIENQYQRDVLERATAVAGPGKKASMIPANRSYKYQYDRFGREIRKAGFSGTHGMRYGYAQDMYERLTGFKCVANGGPNRTQMTPEQRAADARARHRVSVALNHGPERRDVTSIYLGG